MIRRFIITAALIAATSAEADERLVSHRYNPSEVVRLEGRAGVQATVAFGEDEHIENVAIGDANAWQVTPNKRANMLFVKPLARAARTNLTVVTDQRTYVFDLVANPAVRPLYVLRFTYPDAPRPAPRPERPALSAEEAQLAAGTGAPVDPAVLNFNWAHKGKAALVPARLFDDGRSTYLAWRAGVPVPAILIRDDKGAEGPVNYAVRGDVIVVEGVPSLIVLRAGKDSATLTRGAPPAVPSDAVPAALAAAQGEK